MLLAFQATALDELAQMIGVNQNHGMGNWGMASMQDRRLMDNGASYVNDDDTDGIRERC